MVSLGNIRHGLLEEIIKGKHVVDTDFLVELVPTSKESTIGSALARCGAGYLAFSFHISLPLYETDL
jgi:hypothetical protein